MFCPCGSQKKYKSCCLEREVEYFIGPKGKITRQLPLSPADRAVYEEELERFVNATGRLPDEDEKKVLRASSYSGVTELIAEDMRASGARPEVVYAFEKTGLVITNENEAQVTAEELRAWDAAIEEYRTRQADGS